MPINSLGPVSGQPLSLGLGPTNLTQHKSGGPPRDVQKYLPVMSGEWSSDAQRGCARPSHASEGLCKTTKSTYDF